MKRVNIKKIKPFYKKNGVQGRMISKSEKMEIVHLELEPNAILQPHVTDFDIDILAYSGEPEIVIADKKTKLTKTEIIRCEGNISHGINNITRETNEVLIVKKLKKEKK